MANVSKPDNKNNEITDTNRRKVLKNSVAVGGLAASASMPFWSKLAMGASEELVPFSDMEGFIAPPVLDGGIHFLDTSKIDNFYTPNNSALQPAADCRK
jgi:hypothetical protein